MDKTITITMPLSEYLELKEKAERNEQEAFTQAYIEVSNKKNQEISELMSEISSLKYQLERLILRDIETYKD